MFSQVYCFGPESRGQEYKQHWVRQPSPEACLITAPRDPIVSGFLSTDLSSTAGCRVFRRQVATAAPWGAGAPVWAAGASGVWVGAGVPPAGGVPRLARAPSQRSSLLCVVLVEGMLPALTSVLRRRAGHRTPVLSRGGGGTSGFGVRLLRVQQAKVDTSRHAPSRRRSRGCGSLRRGCELSPRAHLCRDRAEVEPLPGRGPDSGRAGEGVTARRTVSVQCPPDGTV